MTKIFKVLTVILIFLCSCQTPQYVVTSIRTSVPRYSTCVADLKPINKRAIKLNIPSALIGCNEYTVGDTLRLTRKEFTNW